MPTRYFITTRKHWFSVRFLEAEISVTNLRRISMWSARDSFLFFQLFFILFITVVFCHPSLSRCKLRQITDRKFLPLFSAANPGRIPTNVYQIKRLIKLSIRVNSIQRSTLPITDPSQSDIPSSLHPQIFIFPLFTLFSPKFPKFIHRLLRIAILDLIPFWSRFLASMSPK